MAAAPAPNGLKKDPSEKGQRQLLMALLEAVRSPVGGEVVVRSGRESARVHVTSGRIAWVNVSTVRMTLSERLTRRGVLSLEDIRNILTHCRKTGENFAETAIAWGLVTGEVMQQRFLEHTVECLAETLRLPNLHCVFSPIQRTYAGKLLFTLEEVLDGIFRLDGEVLGLFVKRGAGESAAEFLDRIDLEGVLEALEPAARNPLDVQVLAGLKGLLAASVTNRCGRSGSLGEFGGREAEEVTPGLDLILAAANHATAISGLGNVVGLLIDTATGMAVVQEFSGGAGIVRCLFAPGTNAALLRLQLDKVLTAQDEAV